MELMVRRTECTGIEDGRDPLKKQSEGYVAGVAIALILFVLKQTVPLGKFAQLCVCNLEALLEEKMRVGQRKLKSSSSILVALDYDGRG